MGNDRVMVTSLDALRSSRDAILAVASRRGARSVRVFGSVARGDAIAGSDVDLLVAFEVGRSLLDQVHSGTRKFGCGHGMRAGSVVSMIS